jgi:hypothetical protein
MQLAILCLCAVAVVVTTRNADGYLSATCRQHLGVYHVTVTYAPNVTSSQIATYHPDGTYNAIDSVANGNPSATSVMPPYSSLSGVWQCDGANVIKVDVLLFLYQVQGFPGALAANTVKSNFDGNGHISGTINTTLYDVASTKNQDRLKWIIIEGPFQYSVQGYKLFNLSTDY